MSPRAVNLFCALLIAGALLVTVLFIKSLPLHS